MSRRNKKEESDTADDVDDLVDLIEITQLSAPLPSTMAVFYDVEKERYDKKPVVLFGVGDILDEDDRGTKVIRGFVSAIGGLESAEDHVDDKAQFVGYWIKKSESWEAFLESHEIPIEDSVEDDEEDDDDE